MNVVVVVSRWYGGTLLGPDRFKHINNAARQVLSMGSFLDTESSVNAEGSSNAKGKKRN
jgi:putative IMPACT (imprinted ancient) family translation regulator